MVFMGGVCSLYIEPWLTRAVTLNHLKTRGKPLDKGGNTQGQSAAAEAGRMNDLKCFLVKCTSATQSNNRSTINISSP